MPLQGTFGKIWSSFLMVITPVVLLASEGGGRDSSKTPPKHRTVPDNVALSGPNCL